MKKFYYKVKLTKIAGKRVQGPTKDAVIVDTEENIPYPFKLFIDDNYIGSGRTLKAMERLAKNNFDLSYKLERVAE